VAIEPKTVAHRQVPPQLAALAEDDADLGGVAQAVGMGLAAEHVQRAGAGSEDAGHHLDHGRFAGAVGAEIADRLAGLDGETDPVHGTDFGILAGDEAAYGAAETGTALELAEGLAHASGGNDR